MTPPPYQPRLRAWGHTWRVLAMLLLSAVALWSPVASGEDWYRRWLPVDLLLAVAAYVVVHLRRRAPVLVAVLLNLVAMVSAGAAGPAVLATVSVATRRRWPEVLLVAAVGIASAQVFSLAAPTDSDDPLWLTTSLSVVATVALVAWGMYVGSRRELLWTLRDRAERAEAAQELRADKARIEERTRIAREMHDVLAHRISQISMQAGALTFREDLGADALRAGVAEIQVHANDALTDLRGVLGVLRDRRTPLRPDGTGEDPAGGASAAEVSAVALAPQPTYADLPALVDAAREQGLRVAFHDDLSNQDVPVPDGVGRTLYRIVQECITNARKHASGALLTIDLGGAPDTGIEIRIANPLGFGAQRSPGVPGSGLGLVGLAERAELGGGWLRPGLESQSFVVRGWIPWLQ